jgi:hypothetical protein
MIADIRQARRAADRVDDRVTHDVAVAVAEQPQIERNLYSPQPQHVTGRQTVEVGPDAHAMNPISGQSNTSRAKSDPNG